jgi:CPA2 family monovalent cation:H+ antiporter-2
MHGAGFLQDLAVVMIVAGLVTLLFHRLKQPVVLGYILAGFIIGPHTPPFPLIHDDASIATLSELGIILLMFSLGLEFNLRKLAQVGAPAITGAILEFGLLFLLGYQVGQAFGWGGMNSVYLGAMLSMSSTTIIIKVLGEMNMMRERFAQITFGILIIEDIFGIAMIAILSSVAVTGNVGLGDVGMTFAKLVIFMAMLLVVGLMAVPRLITYVSRFKSNEMLIVAVVGLCFGVSLLALKLGFSVALGAFIIGAVVAEAREIRKVETLVEPIRDIFSAVFFVTVGMMIDPHIIAEYAWPIVVISLVVVLGKVFSCTLGCLIAGVDGRNSMRVGMSLAQIGEFSFIIASLGVSLKATSEFLYPIAIAVSAITTLLTPYLIMVSDRAVDAAIRVTPRPVMDLLRLHTRWIAEFSRAAPKHPGARLVRSLVAQIALNLTLVAGLFIAAGFLARSMPEHWLPLPESFGGGNTLCWIAAVFVSMPMLIASARKGQALGMLLAEIAATEPHLGSRTAAVRAVIANVVTVLLVAGLLLYVMVLSYAVLPPLHVLAVLIILMAFAAVMFGRVFNRWYTRVKFAVVDAWNTPPDEINPGRPMPSLLHDADMETLVIPEGPASGQLIRDLGLRSRTGASIVAVERAGKTVVNPSAEDELLAGDTVLLIGTPAQLASARRVLTDPAAADMELK